MRKKLKKNKSELLFLAPGTVIYVLFLVVPILVCFYYAFTNWDGISPVYKFIGLRNFKNILSDSRFWDAVKVTLIVTVVSTFLQNAIGILFAVWLNQKNWVCEFCKTILFLPAILSSVVVSFIWSYMTQGNGGILNTILGIFHIPPMDYFANDLVTTLTVTTVISWAGLGLYITIYDATLTTIPDELFEAAKIDGAGKVALFRYITFPMLMPGIIICTIFSLIAGLRQYDFVKIMTPMTIETVSVNAISRMTEYNMFGYASAIVIVLFVSIIVLSTAQRMLLRSKEVSY